MTFIITTPLYYVNDKPHLGSVYTTLICDSIARYKRLIGQKVIFITGTDEHGLKIQRRAEERGIDPVEHCDEISNIFKKKWEEWGITFDRFIRTSSQNHEKIVHDFYNRVKDSGDVYLGVQKGWYCVGCEEFKENPTNSKTTECPIHKKPLEWKNEENLFFRLSNYQNYIETLVREPGFIEPKERRNEVISFVEKGLKDFSISRTNLSWGINVPDTENHTFYVWFDALLGYVSAIVENDIDHSINKSIESGWPASIHLIGKDILRFHAVYWPAMLRSAGMKPPKKVFGHGFLTREGQKMGKSLGNVLDPDLLMSKYGKDPVRWFLLKDIVLGSDGDFQDRRFVDIVNNDLANTIGNLINRTISMSRKWFNNAVPSSINIRDELFIKTSEETTDKILKNFENYQLEKVSNHIMAYATQINLYLNNNQPWSLIKENNKNNEVKQIIYNVLEASRIIAVYLNPILPDLSEEIFNQLGFRELNKKSWIELLEWGLLVEGSLLPKPSPIISKLEYES